MDTATIRSYPEITVCSFGGFMLTGPFICSLNEQPFTRKKSFLSGNRTPYWPKLV